MAVISTIQIDTSNAKKSIADLEKELQEVNEQLKNVEIGSDAFNELQQKAASAKGQLDQLNRTTDTLSKGFQGWGENAAKVTAGISGGITAATAAMQLMGVENENVVEGIAKLQQLMAFTQGISSLKDLSEGFKNLKSAVKVVTGSMNGLKGAIIGTGIGALVVALGLLIANWDKVTEAIDGFIGKAGEASKMTAALDGFFASLKQTIKAVGTTIVNYVTTPFASVINAVKAWNETDGGFVDKAKAAAKAYKDTYVEAYEETKEEYNKIDDEYNKAYNKSIDEQNAEANEKRLEEEKKAAAERAKVAAEAYNKAYQAAQKTLQLENAKAELELYGNEEEILKSKIENQSKFLSSIKEGTLEYYQAAKDLKDLQKQLEELQAEGESTVTTDSTGTSVDNTAKTPKEDPEIAKFRQSLLTKEELYQQSLATRRAQLDQWYQDSQITAEEYSAGMQQIEDEITEKQAEATRQRVAQVTGYVSAIAGFATDILSSFADAQDETTEEGFERSKKLQIAAATINMLTGIATAISGLYTTQSGPWDIALAVAQAASIAAAAGVQIAKIKSTTFDSSSSGSLSTGSIASTLTTPTQYSSAVEGASIEKSIGDSKVYVVESDINQTRSRVSVQERENRY